MINTNQIISPVLLIIVVCSIKHLTAILKLSEIGFMNHNIHKVPEMVIPFGERPVSVDVVALAEETFVCKIPRPEGGSNFT